MKKLLLIFVLSLGLFGCSKRLSMSGVYSEAKALNDVKTNIEEYEQHSDLSECMDWLEDGNDDDLMSFLGSCLNEDPQALTNLYISIDETDKHGFIHYAAAKGSLRVIRKFLELAKNKGILKEVVNLPCEHEMQPIHLAAFRGDVEVVKYFIDNGANPNAKDVYTNTVLHYAARKLDNVKVVQYLLEKAGANIQQTIDEEDGSTLLHWAVENNNSSVLRYLLDYCYSHERLKEFINLKGNVDNITAEQLASKLGKDNINLVYRLFKKKNNLV